MGGKYYPSLKERLKRGSGNVHVPSTTPIAILNRQKEITNVNVKKNESKTPKLIDRFLLEKLNYTLDERLNEKISISEDGIQSLPLKKIQEVFEEKKDAVTKALKLLEIEIEEKTKKDKQNGSNTLKELENQKSKLELEVLEQNSNIEKVIKKNNEFSELFKIINEAGLIDKYNNETLSLYKLINNLEKDLNNNHY